MVLLVAAAIALTVIFVKRRCQKKNKTKRDRQMQTEDLPDDETEDKLIPQHTAAEPVHTSLGGVYP